MSALNTIGNLPYYSRHYDWKTFVERLELYFIANDIEDDIRAPLLLTTIEEDAYNTFRDICYPKLPKETEYDELLKIMQKHIEARPSTFHERVKFHRAEQEENETVTEWVARIKKLSTACNFNYELDRFLLEKFISGLRPGALLDRLCEERPENLNLAGAIKIADNIEEKIETN